ncbi:unnamed protein product [Owenia fusiformis]|uniref:VWFA domain-containing protein n=1 Tax=Owenia fusiformis TaxID=6347 RepID=A0A8S4MZ65_OWEFU|nr:unnamed protein product [Owenia fusiformis]
MELSICTFFLCAVCYHGYVQGYHQETPRDEGSLAGDVQNWAVLIQNYILQLASDGIKREVTQSLFDLANYTYEEKSGKEVVEVVQERLGNYFTDKKLAANRIAEAAVTAYDTWYRENKNRTRTSAPRLQNLTLAVYSDSDIPTRLPKDLKFNPYFRQPVSLSRSTVKIADDVPRDFEGTISAVEYTYALEKVFKENAARDPLLRWQYFGSTAGIARLYPGREWAINFAGFYNDYDPRTRPWYIAATSGPKDVVIVLDCSKSMAGDKFKIAQGVAKTVINTLTKQDYVNVVCARASHWDEVGKWHLFTTEVLSCQQEHMVPATVAHRKDLIEKIYKLKPGGTSELEKGFEMAFDLLQSTPRTGCQSIMVFATDGKDTDGEQVRCGPGYYTRSGYVPGPICKYNWTKVWDVSDTMNEKTDPKARIFSYLTVEDGELFPGKLACKHRGSMVKLTSGENLISKMADYFHFLAKNSKNSLALWTSPYIDAFGLGLMVTHAVPAISKETGQTIGVAGIDATLDEMELFLTRHQWGSVYSFLINKEGETIFHPFIKPSTKLLDDPIFIPIQQLEQDKKGSPPEFSTVLREMKAGKTGSLRIEKARRGTPKGDARAGIKYDIMPGTYYYAAMNDSEYAFAFNLADTDKVFRRSQEPIERPTVPEKKSYFNLLIEYNSTLARKELPGVFEYLKVKYDEPKYPNLRVSYGHSSIFLAPKCHCDPNKYFYNDDLAQKTVDAHKWINGILPDVGCDNGNMYEKGVRADVLITQPVEEVWRDREFEYIHDVKWTYVGLRTGVFRTYPAHRSTRAYDPSKRPWFYRAKSDPSKTSISTVYMDAAGVGKILTISQAVFEGMTGRTNEECRNISATGPWPGGCPCTNDDECIIGVCYLSKAPGENKDQPRCATERVEAVTSLDILYNSFHKTTMDIMESSDPGHLRSCGKKYDCPDGEPQCETRCYLFDNRANLITDPDFLEADNLDTSKYKGITMGKKEGEVMKDLIYQHHLFQRIETIDFQGSCSISPGAPKVTLKGIPQTPEETDDYYKNRGPIPKFSNSFGCIQDVVAYAANLSALGPSNMITGNVSGPCMSGFYYVTPLPKTNLLLLVIENWKQYKDSFFYNFNCKIARSIVNSGAYRIINGTCSHEDPFTSTLAENGMCPIIRNLDIPCTYQGVRVQEIKVMARFGRDVTEDSINDGPVTYSSEGEKVIQSTNSGGIGLGLHFLSDYHPPFVNSTSKEEAITLDGDATITLDYEVPQNGSCLGHVAACDHWILGFWFAHNVPRQQEGPSRWGILALGSESATNDGLYMYFEQDISTYVVGMKHDDKEYQVMFQTEELNLELDSDTTTTSESEMTKYHYIVIGWNVESIDSLHELPYTFPLQVLYDDQYVRGDTHVKNITLSARSESTSPLVILGAIPHCAPETSMTFHSFTFGTGRLMPVAMGIPWKPYAGFEILSIPYDPALQCEPGWIYFDGACHTLLKKSSDYTGDYICSSIGARKGIVNSIERFSFDNSLLSSNEFFANDKIEVTVEVRT